MSAINRGFVRRAVSVSALLVLLTVASCGGGGGGSSGGQSATNTARCSDFIYQEDAQAAYRAGQTQLDGDNDGIACESLPHRPGSPSTPATPSTAITQGVYTGTLTGSTSTQFQLLALENGDAWALYGVPSGASFFVRGFMQGRVAQSGTTLGPSAVQDFGVNPPVTGAITGTITASAVSGTVVLNGAAISFSGTPPASSTYNYNTAPILTDIVGNWTLSGLDGTSASVSIGSNGSFAGSNAGCLISGNFTPRPSGKNVFDVTVTSGPSPCIAPGSTSTGVGITYLLQNSTTRQLIFAGVSAGRSGGNAFFGTR